MAQERLVHPIIAELKDKRIKRGLSLEKVGDMAGYTGTHIWSIEHARQRATIEMILDLGQALGGRLRWEWEND